LPHSPRGPAQSPSGSPSLSRGKSSALLSPTSWQMSLLAVIGRRVSHLFFLPSSFAKAFSTSAPLASLSLGSSASSCVAGKSRLRKECEEGPRLGPLPGETKTFFLIKATSSEGLLPLLGFASLIAPHPPAPSINAALLYNVGDIAGLSRTFFFYISSLSASYSTGEFMMASSGVSKFSLELQT